MCIKKRKKNISIEVCHFQVCEFEFPFQLNIPCSDSQVVLTPEQIEGIMSAEGNSQSLSPAIGTATFSSLQSSSE